MLTPTYKPEDQKLLDECIENLGYITKSIHNKVGFFNPNTTYQEINDAILNSPERNAILAVYRELLNNLIPIYEIQIDKVDVKLYNDVIEDGGFL
jgi:hypothetical protein